MELIELKANTRTTTGNGPARALRREGRLPAVLYGPNTDPILLSVDTSEFEHSLKNVTVGQVLLNLVIENGESAIKTAMVKELQVDPLTRNYLHIDFYEIAMDRKILVKVPVTTKGESKGVEMGGMLQVIRRELEVSCLPMEIPQSFEIDITDMDIGDSIHVDEIPLEGNIEIPYDVNFTVITLLSPTVEEEPVAEEEVGEEAEAAEAAEEASAAGAEE